MIYLVRPSLLNLMQYMFCYVGIQFKEGKDHQKKLNAIQHTYEHVRNWQYSRVITYILEKKFKDIDI